MKQSCLLALNGSISRRIDVKHLSRDARSVIAADGAARTLLKRGVTPDVIGGDLDSVGKLDKRFAQITFLYDPSQEDTDFDKALRYIISKKSKAVVVIGAFGKRTDHSLNMMSVAARYADAIDIVFLNDDCLVHVLRVGWHSFASEPGETVSLIPVGAVEGVTTEGLAYPLDGERLALGERDGISNEATHRKFSVGLRSGVLLLFRPHHEYAKYVRI